jgi:hypothetical protein
MAFGMSRILLFLQFAKIDFRGLCKADKILSAGIKHVRIVDNHGRRSKSYE